MTSFACLRLPCNRMNSRINRHHADFVLRRSSTNWDDMDHPHEICDAASVQLGNKSLLGLEDRESVARNSYVRSNLRQLYSRWRKINGYRFGLLICIGSMGTIVLINSILTIWAWKSLAVNAGFRTIQRGHCAQTKKLNLWFHLAINVLGTALLSASNYTMQCLSSPTRQEINKAHSQNEWLDIGVPSVRNLKRITRKRIVLWSLLALTSLPLQLMYNSAVFDTLAIQEYAFYVVSEEFISGAPFNISRQLLRPFVLSGPYNISWADFPQYYTAQLEILRGSDSDVKIKEMTVKECILAYGNGLGNSKYKDVAAVSSINNATDSLLYFSPVHYWNPWFCDNYQGVHGDCDVDEAVKHAQDLTLTGYPIDHCLVQEMDEKCMLQLSLPIMLVVIMCNLIKLICMVYTLTGERSQPLLTVGDAIASFLNEPDPTTKHICLADRFFFQKKGWQAKMLTWKPERHRWYRAASIMRWLVCNSLWVNCLLI